MNYKSQNMIYVILSGLILFCTFFSVNYTIKSQIYNDLEYGMSIEHVKLIKSSDIMVHFDNIINLQHDTNIVIISEFNNKSYTGIYDPIFFYANENSVKSLGVTRYFSIKDYVNKTKSVSA